MKALMFCGYHNTGKTSLIEKVVAALSGRGYSVATVKHTPKNHLNMHPGNRDTDRLLTAGSLATVQVTADSIVQYRRRDKKQSTGLLFTTLSEELTGDFLLIEGFKEYEDLPRIVFGRSKQDIERIATETTVAFSGWEIPRVEIRAIETELQIPYLSFTVDANRLVDFIEKTAMSIDT